MDMVMSMISNFSLPKSLWMHALKTAMYLLNRVPSKAVPKILFELWTGRKPSLRHLHVWGCPAEIKVYNPHESKLDARTTSGYFIGYPEKSKGYRFNCPNHSPRIVETGNSKFIENGEVSGSTERNDATIKEVRVDIPLPVSTPLLTSTSNVVPVTEANTRQNLNEETLPEGTNSQESNTNEPQEIPLRRSERQNRYAILDDYVVYLQEHMNNPSYMVKHAILMLTNEEVDRLNNNIIAKYSGYGHILYSFDLVEDDPHNLYQQEFLSSISPSRMSPHVLRLKKGVPIMLLRNIDPKAGLCNGTRLIYRDFLPNLIDAEILTGKMKGDQVFIL
ncbi:Retrovirus-related Pol polyprotein from transposon TNT 1-94 [Senna tora]|uniref:Retrovirus-related Pol polyprotein from transposon TNT 1-94 n=1 Tax=Senna tora TaxID=362788 RepID=A0A834TJV9_9FABA|nr:Retrovirus-related Pol polyprotein from transposon TNT 1-94 [Senna tora]